MKRTFFKVAYSFLNYRGAASIRRSGHVVATLCLLAGCSVVPSVPDHPAVTHQPAPVAPVSQSLSHAPRIGLALGSGAARGFAHIGVLQVLEEQGIKADLIVGTSAGSMVATLYAAGKTPTELGNLAMTMDESSLTDWVFPGRSLIKGEALAKFVRGYTGSQQIEDMRLPLGIVATDLHSGQPILFRKGDPGVAVRASSSIPAVFEPTKIAGHEYIDGAATSPIPVRFAKRMGADVVIAVDISSVPELQPTKGPVDILLQTFNIMGHAISQFELKEADVVIRPKLDGVGSAEFSARRLAILAGREATLTVLPQLREKIATKTH